MNGLRTEIGIDGHGLAIADAGATAERLGSGLLEQPGDAAGKPGDDAIFPGHGLAEIDRRRSG